MRRRAAFGLLLIIAGVAAGCAGRQPAPCRDVFSAARCAAMTVFAASRLEVDANQIVAIDVLPEPTPETRDGQIILQTRSGGPPVDVLVTLETGVVVEVSMSCSGIATGAQCLDEPRLQASSAISNGYRDIPCAGEPPLGCATPVPPPSADGLAAATELRIGHLDIHVAAIGDQAILLGELRLPNGLLSESSFAIVDDMPAGMIILSSRIELVVRSLEPDGRPFWNVYDHGWRAGTERVAAWLIFTVDAVEPGAVLSIRDVVVR
ncbi:MAG: hypothetical protein EPO36_09250 [Chloroflexota bacterium]|nr:MAG: hypothetical protein EPO36_09250 [Chloroflexota bacterium]